MGNLCIYYRTPPEKHRFFPGDQSIRRIIRTLIRGKQKISGVDRVFLNLCHGLDLLGIDYVVNKPFEAIQPDDKIIVLGRDKFALDGYQKSNKIIAGIALMTHPSEWPDLIEKYPIAKYLQHSKWANNVYRKYYGDQICDTWFAGIDTNYWEPNSTPKTIDFLIYVKFQWDIEEKKKQLLLPVIAFLEKNNLSYKMITYGKYKAEEYKTLLASSKNMIFFSEHESQGFACCEAMAMDVPVFAWDQESCLDPNRFIWNDHVIPATSVPFFEERCGLIFENIQEFQFKIQAFINTSDMGQFTPRAYILENLTLEKSAQRMLDLVSEVYS